MQVVLGAASGWTNPKIATVFGLSRKTVQTHLANAAKRMELEHGDRALIVAECFRRGLLMWEGDQMVVCTVSEPGEEDDKEDQEEAITLAGEVCDVPSPSPSQCH